MPVKCPIIRALSKISQWGSQVQVGMFRCSMAHLNRPLVQCATKACLHKLANTMLPQCLIASTSKLANNLQQPGNDHAAVCTMDGSVHSNLCSSVAGFAVCTRLAAASKLQTGAEDSYTSTSMAF